MIITLLVLWRIMPGVIHPFPYLPSWCRVVTCFFVDHGVLLKKCSLSKNVLEVV